MGKIHRTHRGPGLGLSSPAGAGLGSRVFPIRTSQDPGTQQDPTLPLRGETLPVPLPHAVEESAGCPDAFPREKEARKQPRTSAEGWTRMDMGPEHCPSTPQRILQTHTSHLISHWITWSLAPEFGYHYNVLLHVSCPVC